MSNNNHPHGHLNQSAQNPSWNPLQIPSYIPRQPQLAHMNNERAMVRSPLAWHATAQPAEAIYNFMSANHKNLEHHQMNPLLAPPYAGLSPFDSMDLSLQSSRTSASPISKGIISQQQLQSHSTQQQQQSQQQQPHLHTPNNYPPIQNLSTSTTGGGTHSQQQQSQQQHLPANMASPASQHTTQTGGHQSVAPTPPPPLSSSPSTAAAVAKYLNTNGTDCERMLPPTSTTTSNLTDNGNTILPASPGNYVHSTREENYSAKMTQIKRNYENESKSMQKPVELVSKDCNYTSLLPNKLSTQTHHQQQHHSNKKSSPLGKYQQQQSPYNISPPTRTKHNGPHTPPTPLSPVMQHQAALQQQLLPTPPDAASMVGTHGLDYNQLNLQRHLHQQQTGNYPHSHQQQSLHLHYGQQQQQQQHHHQQQQSHQHHHHQIHQQQQQSYHNFPPTQHLTQQQQQQQQSQNQLQSQHGIETNHLTDLDAQPKRSQMHGGDDDDDDEQPIITDLSTTTYRAPAPPPPPPLAAPHSQPSTADNSCLSNTTPINAISSTDAPESPYMVTSNEESLESNSNSSNSRMRRKRKATKVVRIGSNTENIGTEFRSTSRSPRMSPAPTLRKPISPNCVERSNFNFSMPPNAIPTTPHTNDNYVMQEKAQNAHANGCSMVAPLSTPMLQPDHVGHVPHIAISKINESSNSNSNSSNSNIEPTRAPPPQSSPKTKKQRQALKLRNAGEPSLTQTDEDSAQICEQLEATTKQSTTPVPDCQLLGVKQQTSTQPAPPSPQSISSCSSSSTSSSVSQTSRSSMASRKTEKTSNTEIADTPASPSPDEKGIPPKLDDAVPSPDDDPTHFELDVSPPVHKCKSPVDNNEPLALKMEQIAVDKIETNRSCFEEVENKLEEMFAGIEDEPIRHDDDEDEDLDACKTQNGAATMQDVNDVAKDLSLALELDTKLELKMEDVVAELSPAKCEHIVVEEEEEKKDKHTIKDENATTKDVAVVKLEGSLPTKAAKKSTLPSPIKADTPPRTTTILTPTTTPLSDLLPITSTPVTTPSTKQTELPTTENTKLDLKPAPTAPPPVAQTKRPPPRRRLSVNMDPDILRISFEMEMRKTAQTKRRNVKASNNKELSVDFDDEKPSTSAAAAAAMAAKEKEHAAAVIAAQAAATAEAAAAAAAVTQEKSSSGGSRKRNLTKNKRPVAASGLGGNGTNVKNTTKNTTAVSKQQQTKQRRKRENSTDDDSALLPAPPLIREPNGASAAAAAATAAAAELKYKSPFILVKRGGSITVINAPTAEDVSETKTKKVKKPTAVYAHERKNIRGMHSSTLSNKYDADTTDSTWICVFCKRGPHRMGLGDLFGPYLVSIDCEEYRTAINSPGVIDLDGAFVSKRRRADMVQLNKRNLPVVPATLHGTQTSPRKKKKKSCEETPTLQFSSPESVDPLNCSAELKLISTFRGMSKITENSYEVWLHEDCTVWAPDVFLVGARILGLDAAVWNSTRYHCVVCANAGAITCCLQRDCKATAHVPCAREAHWSLDEKSLKVYCQQHAAANISANVTKLARRHISTRSPSPSTMYNNIVSMWP